MAVALIGVLGTVVVALLGVFVSRIESRDSRSRLMKDLEISSKLETKSLAWQVMDKHIARVAQGLVDRERRRDEDRFARRMVTFGIISAIVVLAVAIVQHPNMGDFNGLLTAIFRMFFVYMVVFPALALISFIRVERKRRQHSNSGGQMPEAEAEQTD
jgi:hypothetical protein